MLLKIIARAGLEPWAKLFQNLRATRETELAEIYPMHVVLCLDRKQPIRDSQALLAGNRSTPKGLACPNKTAGKQILAAVQDQNPAGPQ